MVRIQVLYVLMMSWLSIFTRANSILALGWNQPTKAQLMFCIWTNMARLFFMLWVDPNILKLVKARFFFKAVEENKGPMFISGKLNDVHFGSLSLWGLVPIMWGDGIYWCVTFLLHCAKENLGVRNWRFKVFALHHFSLELQAERSTKRWLGRAESYQFFFTDIHCSYALL